MPTIPPVYPSSSTYPAGFDEDLESLTLGSLDLNDQEVWQAEAITLSPPTKRLQRLSSPDADSDILAEAARYELRTITLRLRWVVGGPGDIGDAFDAINELQGILQQAEELEEGVPLTWTPASSLRSGTMYVQSGEITDMPITVSGEDAGWFIRQPVINLRLDCFPFIHGTEYSAATAATSSSRVLSLTADDVPGTVPGIGRLVITDTGTQTRRHVEIGGDRYGYSASAKPDLVYADLTALAGTGVSSTYYTYDVTSAPIAIAEATALPHLGPHKLRAQVERTSATDNLYVRGAVRTVDGPWKYTPWRTVPQLTGKFDVMLGEVDFKPVVKGTQSSTIRFEAYSDSTVTCRLHRLMPLPTEVVYGVSRSLISSTPPTSFPIFDQFNQSAGALAGKTAGAGGTWAGAGDTDDFAVETTGKTAQRTAVSDSSFDNGRFATVGSSTFTDLVHQGDVKFSAPGIPGYFGVLARYVDTSNYVVVAVVPDTTPYAMVQIRVAGVSTYSYATSAYFGVPTIWYRLKFSVDTKGNWSAWVGFASLGLSATPTFTGTSSALATGGALASGKVGIYDSQTAATANTRNYDNLFSYAPSEDVPLYSGRVAEFGSSYAIRQNSGGTGWADVPSYRGRRLFIPPAGPADLTTRIVVKDRATDVDGGDVDSSDYSRSAELFVTPRYLSVPGG